MSTTTITKRYPSRDGSFGVTVTPQIIKETDRLRGDVPRSRWVERALRMYNASVAKEEGKTNEKGVRGSEVTSHTSHSATPTPSTEVIARKTTKFINKGDLAIEEQ